MKPSTAELPIALPEPPTTAPVTPTVTVPGPGARLPTVPPAIAPITAPDAAPVKSAAITSEALGKNLFAHQSKKEFPVSTSPFNQIFGLESNVNDLHVGARLSACSCYLVCAWNPIHVGARLASPVFSVCPAWAMTWR